MTQSGGKEPLVSVVLATRDRPSFLVNALECYRRQTYTQRELIVVDSGDTFPADSTAIAGVGGCLIRAPSGLLLGPKLNLGVARAQGTLCHKMDDDDWYAPTFIETIVATIQATNSRVCHPMLATIAPSLFFDVGRWEIRQSIQSNVPGGALLFAREDWQAYPFRELPRSVDTWFLRDHIRAGSILLPVFAPELFLCVRHGGDARNRGHTWTHNWDGQALEAHLQEQPLYGKAPEGLLPPWALSFYQTVRRELRTSRV